MSDRVGLWRDKPDKFCMGLLTTFAPSESHKFCIAGAGKCRILRAQACEIVSSHSWASFYFLAFEERHDRHRVAKPKTEVDVQPHT